MSMACATAGIVDSSEAFLEPRLASSVERGRRGSESGVTGMSGIRAAATHVALRRSGRLDLGS